MQSCVHWVHLKIVERSDMGFMPTLLFPITFENVIGVIFTKNQLFIKDRLFLGCGGFLDDQIFELLKDSYYKITKKSLGTIYLARGKDPMNRRSKIDHI